MTEQAERHLRSIKEDFCSLIEDKYRLGHQKHNVEGGEPELETVPVRVLVQHALEEALDQVVYLLTLRRALREREKDYSWGSVGEIQK